MQEALRVIGAKWCALSPEERQPYEEMARQDKARYQKEIAELNSEAT